MTVNWKRAVAWIIAILFLVALVYFFVEAFSSKPSPTALMLDTVTLHSINETVQRAEIITRMDRTVKGLENDAIAAQWATLSNCIAGNVCTQDDYFDFLLMIAVEKKKEVPHAELIGNAITVNRYWGNSEKIIEFSKTLSDANEQVAALGLRTVANKWHEIIACDGKCQNYHASFFEFIRLLISV
jgi:hypothetical protein